MKLGQRFSLVLVLATLLGVGLMLPSLFSGFLFDDYFNLAQLDGELLGEPRPFDLFDFINGDPWITIAKRDAGKLPWWILPELKLAFLRPLSSALHALDHRWFGHSALPQHAHSLLWFAGLIIVLAFVWRRALPGSIGVLALFLFALDDAHVTPVAWIANRNALVATLPVWLGLLAHLRWREQGWRPGLPLSIGGYAVGLLGGEAAFGALAYVVSYELLAGEGSFGRRLCALLPATVIAIVYLALYRALGYGAFGSGIYFDPAQQPAAYLAALPARIAMLMSGALANVTSDLWMMLPAMRGVLVVVGTVATIAFVWLLRATAPTRDAPQRRALRWMLGGAALSLLPVAATFPSDRLLLSAMVGIVAGLAAVIRCAWDASVRRSVRIAARVLFVLHVVIAPLYLLVVQGVLTWRGRDAEAVARSVELPNAPQEIVIPVAIDHVIGVYLPLIRAHLGESLGTSWRVLSLAPYDHELTRVDDRTLELRVDRGQMMGTVFEALYRAPEFSLQPGQVIEAGAMTVQVIETNDRGPTRVSYRFDRALDHASLTFLDWRNGALERLTLPAIGASVRLKRWLGPAGF